MMINAYRLLYSLFSLLGLIHLKSIRKSFLKLKGSILDIGVGDTGNYSYYPHKAKITVLDIDKRMLDKAKKLYPKYNFVHGDAADLSTLPSNSFDYVVAVFIYCSVRSPVHALREAKRVLRKDGKIVIIAHVLSKNPVFKTCQKLMNPFTKTFFGTDMARDIRRLIIKSGFRIFKEQNTGWTDIFKVFIAKKP